MNPELRNYMITKVLLSSSLIKKQKEKSQVRILGLRASSLIAVLLLIVRPGHRRYMAKIELPIGWRFESVEDVLLWKERKIKDDLMRTQKWQRKSRARDVFASVSPKSYNG